MGDAAWHTSGLGDVSRWPLRAHRHPERADVDGGHAQICTSATRPGRDRNTGRRGADSGRECGSCPCGHAAPVPAVVLVHFYGLATGSGVLVNCSDSSRSSPSAWAKCAENRRVFTGAGWYFSSQRLVRQWIHVL